MSIFETVLVVLAFWVGSLLILALAIFAIRHVYTSRGWRSWGIPMGLFGALFVTVLPTFIMPAVVVFTIPMAIVLFAITLLLLVYNTYMSNGMKSVAKQWGADDIFPGLLPNSERPGPRDYTKYNRYVRALLRFTDWFEPQLPEPADHDR